MRSHASAIQVIALFVALRHRNFRLLWIGLLVSFSGSLMQSAAILWHVSLLVPENKRALALGLVGLAMVPVALPLLVVLNRSPAVSPEGTT